ncbi:MAG: alpha/beta hydrolase [Actinomycetota bacterium]
MTASSRTLSVETLNGMVTSTIWESPEGRPAVLLAGVNGAAASWATVVEGVAGARTLIAIDLRGRGLSAMEGPWGVAAHAEDVAGVLSTVSAAFGGPVTVVGHSFGAHVAACLAVGAPEVVNDLILVDAGPPRRIPADSSADEVIDGALANIIPNLGSLPFPVMIAAVTADFRSMVVDDEATALLPHTTQPLHLIRAGHGVAPGLPPIIDEEALVELLGARQAEVTLVDEATHFSLLGDHADVVVKALLRP